MILDKQKAAVSSMLETAAFNDERTSIS